MNNINYINKKKFLLLSLIIIIFMFFIIYNIIIDLYYYIQIIILNNNLMFYGNNLNLNRTEQVYANFLSYSYSDYYFNLNTDFNLLLFIYVHNIFTRYVMTNIGIITKRKYHNI
jgi:hypothetical protein